jgi:GT2 family glycosyltransferase
MFSSETDSANDPLANAARPMVSVITTLLFPRSRPLDCLVSWTLGQQFPHDQIELIVVANSRRGVLEREVASILRAQDKMIRFDSKNEMALYDAGARAASGTWLLFTEPHCMADPHCIRTLAEYVVAGNFAGACVRTLPTEERCRVARMEARMYLEDARVWTQENDWRKFTKRGFLLSRSAYEDVGGFDASHLRFAEITIAAKLHRKGYRLGFASGAAITHYNSTALWELLDYVWEFRRLERKVAQDFPDLLASPASSDADAELVRACRDPEFRSSARSALKKPLLFALRTIGRADSRLMAKLIANLWVQFSIAPRFPSLMSVGRAASRFLWAWLRFHLPQSDDRAYAAYKQVWQSFGDLSVATSADFFSDPQMLVPLPAGQVCRIGEQSGVHFVGFHSTESWNGTAFRWSGVLSALRFQLAEEPPIIALNVLPVRSLRAEELFVCWNGVRLNYAREWSTPTHLVYRAGCGRARERHVREPKADLLTLVCPPIARAGSADSRVLGLPLVSVERFGCAVSGEINVAGPAA